MSYKKNKFFIQRKIKAFKFLMQEFDLDMREAQRWIDKKRVLVNGEVLSKKSAYLLGEFEVITFQTKTKNLLPIFETREFAIYDKPSGVLVHPSNRDTDYSLTHELKHRFGKGANITHRLDKETSGLVIVSKHKNTEKEIKRLFEEKKVKKTYIAYVKGHIKQNFIIDAPIKKNREFSDIKLKVLISKDGKRSQTIINPLKYEDKYDVTLIQAIPLTGRQHQIRAHLNYYNYPIVGDPIYGVNYQIADAYLNGKLDIKERIKYTGADRLLLHANSLEFFYKCKYKIFSKSDFTFSSHLK